MRRRAWRSLKPIIKNEYKAQEHAPIDGSAIIMMTIRMRIERVKAGKNVKLAVGGRRQCGLEPGRRLSTTSTPVGQ